ncbi:hypothetical protein CLAIMM_13968 [Cladophialophora immunda]|nr:hypothetical protein CLAIMM_13968 [Cladophialophora immunda]
MIAYWTVKTVPFINKKLADKEDYDRRLRQAVQDEAGESVEIPLQNKSPLRSRMLLLMILLLLLTRFFKLFPCRSHGLSCMLLLAILLLTSFSLLRPSAPPCRAPSGPSHFSFFPRISEGGREAR